MSRSVLSFLALVLACGCGGAPDGRPFTPIGALPEQSIPEGAPSVILVSIDTLRPDRLGCYGNPMPASPNIDRFRERAVLFSLAVAQAPSTLPSHATMLTSLLPEHHGAFFSRRAPLADGLPTLASVLASAGYRTAAFTGGGQMAPEFGLDRGFEIYGVNEGGPYFTDAVRSGLEWLQREPVRPFFLFLHTYEVHHPYTPDPDLLALFDGGYDGPLPETISKELLESVNRDDLQIDDRDLAHIIAAYDAEIRSVDTAFGELMTGLEELGILDDTLIIFTSDHGEEFGEHGVVGWHSHTLYDELLRVPLLIRFPDDLNAGTRVNGQVRLLDLAPTVTAVTGVTPPPTFEGIDLRQVIDGLPTPLPALAQLDLPLGQRAISMRTRSWKLYPRVAFTGNPFSDEKPPLTTRIANRYRLWKYEYALYDLENDPGEHVDVHEENFWTATGHEKLIDKLSGNRAVPPPAPTITVDDATQERLRALGYVD